LPVRKQPSIGEVILHTSPAGVGDNPKITGSDSGLVTIIDVGKNIAGVCSLAFSGPAGAEINIRYGELLRPDGSLNAMTSVAGQIKGGQPAKECPGGNAPAIAYQQDVVTLAGSNSKEVFEPKFCWHAFRYVAVAAPQTVKNLTASDIHCTPLRTDNPVVSEYDSSGNLLLGKIHEMTQRTFENNMVREHFPLTASLPYERISNDCLAPVWRRCRCKVTVHTAKDWAMVGMHMRAERQACRSLTFRHFTRSVLSIIPTHKDRTVGSQKSPLTC
jgi:hypothetical protein